MSIRVETLHGIEHLDDLWDSWMALLPPARWAGFLHPGWCRALWTTHYPDARVRIYVAWDGDRLVGVLPICRRRMNRFGLFLPVAESFGGGRGDYSLPAVVENDDEETLFALLDAAVEGAKGAGTLVLANIPTSTAQHASLERFLESRRLQHTREVARCLLVPIEDTYEETEAAFSSSMRSELRRRRRRFEEDVGPLSHRVIESCPEALELLPAFYEMHDRRWLEKGLPGTFSDPASRRFYERTIEDLWDEGVNVSVLETNGRMISMHFGLVCQHWLLDYKPTFDTEFYKYSPGRLHLRELLEYGVEYGWKGIDFLQGEERYKEEWASGTNETASHTIRTSRLAPSYWWLTRGRPFAEEKVGPLYTKVAAKLGSLRRNIGGE